MRDKTTGVILEPELIVGVLIDEDIESSTGVIVALAETDGAIAEALKERVETAIVTEIPISSLPP